jgi:hypothetical protein
LDKIIVKGSFKHLALVIYGDFDSKDSDKLSNSFKEEKMEELRTEKYSRNEISTPSKKREREFKIEELPMKQTKYNFTSITNIHQMIKKFPLYKFTDLKHLGNINNLSANGTKLLNLENEFSKMKLVPFSEEKVDFLNYIFDHYSNFTNSWEGDLKFLEEISEKVLKHLEIHLKNGKKEIVKKDLKLFLNLLQVGNQSFHLFLNVNDFPSNPFSPECIFYLVVIFSRN